MRIFREVTPEAVAAALRETGEAIAPSELAPMHHDWRWHVRLPGDRMLLVPTDDAGARRLQRERRLLAALAPRVTFAVPRPLDDVDGPLDIRQRVPGEVGMHLHWSTLEDPVLATAYAGDLARVLAELHVAFSPTEAAALAGAQRPETYPLPAERLVAVVGSLPAEVHHRVRAAIDRYTEILAAPADLVLVHGDVGTHNLAFVPGTRRVAGLFDFEEASCADRHLDFKHLPSYGPRVLGLVLDDYRERTGVAIDIPRMRVLHLMTALSFWAWREDDPEAHDRLSSRDRDQALAWIGHALFAV
jgi:aminoglycoside phosphotransferase (APT) family kinase protein